MVECYSLCNRCKFPTRTNYVVQCGVVISVVFFHKWLTGQLNVNELSLPLGLGPLNCANFLHAVLSDYTSFKVLQILIFPSLLPFSQSACLCPSLYYSGMEPTAGVSLEGWGQGNESSCQEKKHLGMHFPLLWFLRGIPTLTKALVLNSLAERDYKMQLSQSALRCRWDEGPSDISISRDS